MVNRVYPSQDGRFERFHPEIYATGTRIDKVDLAAGDGVSFSSCRASCPANRARGLCLWENIQHPTLKWS